MNFKSRTFIWGIVLLTFPILINHILGIFATEKYMTLLARYFSDDGVIACDSCVIKILDKPFLFLILAWVIFFIFWQKFNRQDFDLFHFRSIPFDLKLAWIIFFALTISWSVFKFLNLHPEYYMEDHFLEYLTAVLLLASAFFVFLRAIYPGKYNRAVLLLIALVFFLLGMEEISWGQRIIGWETPEALSTYNYQNETNLHNVINPIMTPIYVIANLIIGCVLLFTKEISEFLSKFSYTKSIAEFLPTAEYASLGFIFLFLSLHRFWFGDELTEQTFAVIGLAYAFFLYFPSHHIQTEAFIKRMIH